LLAVGVGGKGSTEPSSGVAAARGTWRMRRDKMVLMALDGRGLNRRKGRKRRG
jgi:hypothetical protein